MKIFLDDREHQLFHLVTEKLNSLELNLTIEKKNTAIG